MNVPLLADLRINRRNPRIESRSEFRRLGCRLACPLAPCCGKALELVISLLCLLLELHRLLADRARLVGKDL